MKSLKVGHGVKNLQAHLQILQKNWKKTLLKSDKIISLTYVGRNEIIKNKWSTDEKIGVIPTCVDFKNFPKFDQRIRIKTRNDLKLDLDSNILVYSGSLGGNYEFKDFSTVFRTFLQRDEKNRIIILSKTPIDYLKNQINKFSLNIEKFKIIRAPFKDVYKYLQASDIGLIIYKKAFSTIGRSPTKLGEYWASGIPTLSLKGIGDLELIISKYPYGGLLVDDLNQDQLNSSLDFLSEDVSKEKLRQQKNITI